MITALLPSDTGVEFLNVKETYGLKFTGQNKEGSSHV